MTRDELIERVAQEIATAMGDGPDKIAPLPSSDYYDAATRIVDLLSPVLEWENIDGGWRSGGYEIDPASSAFTLWHGSPEGADTIACRIDLFPTLEAAKAAAQAHATAKWIATTKAAKEQAND